MYKLFVSLLFLLCLMSCSDEGTDCFKKEGKIQTQEVFVENFSRISISAGIELIVKESPEQIIRVTAGKNLMDDIELEVVEGELKISNKSGCEMLRNYHTAKVFVSTPVLEKIYSSSQYSIRSEGILTYPELILESGIVEDTPASLFEMEIHNQKLIINDNISSVFKIKGTTDLLEVSFWGSNGRLEAGNFRAKEISVYHRSTNDMIVFPVEKISGKIMSTGNLVLKNLPPIVEVEQMYTGHIVYP